MKLSTRASKYIPICGNGKSGIFAKYVVIMVDCKRVLKTAQMSEIDNCHNHLIKDKKCKLLLNESPVINGKDEIIFHYTSNTYKE